MPSDNSGQGEREREREIERERERERDRGEQVEKNNDPTPSTSRRGKKQVFVYRCRLFPYAIFHTSEMGGGPGASRTHDPGVGEPHKTHLHDHPQKVSHPTPTEEALDGR